MNKNNRITELSNEISKVQHRALVLEQDLRHLKHDDKTINDTIKMEERIGEKVRDNNRHLSELKENYQAFFDEESGNTLKESLAQVKEYVADETEKTNSLIQENKAKFFNLRKNIRMENANNQNSNNSSDNSGQSGNLHSSSDNIGSDHTGSDSTGQIGNLNSSRISDTSNNGNLPDTKFSESGEMKFLEDSNIKLLNFIILLLKAFCGDDSQDD